MDSPYQTSTLTLNGMTFRVQLRYDRDMGPPWKEHDGHGPVSGWTTRDKKPGERVLIQDRDSRRYYDMAEAQAIALRDGWGVKDSAGKSKRQIAAEAVEEDYQRMKAWCNNEWHWCGVLVRLLDVDGCPTNKTASLWGIESDSDDYLDTVARELAEEIAAEVPESGELCVQVRKVQEAEKQVDAAEGR